MGSPQVKVRKELPGSQLLGQSVDPGICERFLLRERGPDGGVTGSHAESPPALMRERGLVTGAAQQGHCHPCEGRKGLLSLDRDQVKGPHSRGGQSRFYTAPSPASGAHVVPQ